MPEPGRVHLVRHGRTALNAEGRFRGRRDVPLDRVGLEEVQKTAGRLVDAVASDPRLRPIVALRTSPLQRTRRTASAIGLLLDLEPMDDERLIDLDVGAWTGLTLEEAAARDPEELRRFREDPIASTPPDGEPVARLERRMWDAVNNAAGRLGDGDVVLVSHDGPIRATRHRFVPAMWAWDLPTAAILTLSRDELGAWSCGDPW